MAHEKHCQGCPLISLPVSLKPMGKVRESYEHTSIPGNEPALYTHSDKFLTQKYIDVTGRLLVDGLFVIINVILCHFSSLCFAQSGIPYGFIRPCTTETIFVLARPNHYRWCRSSWHDNSFRAGTV